MTILLPPNPAQFRGFVGVGVKEAQSTLGGRGVAGLPLLVMDWQRGLEVFRVIIIF